MRREIGVESTPNAKVAAMQMADMKVCLQHRLFS